MKDFVPKQKVVVSTGVGTIVAIGQKTFYGHTDTYYTIELSESIQHIPAHQMPQRCRRLSTLRELRAAFILLTKKPKPYSGYHHKQLKEIEGRRTLLPLADQAALVRDLSPSKATEWTQKTAIYESCLAKLADECAAVLRYPKDTMADLIEATITKRTIPDSLDFE